jgi:hypothetical protein
MAKAGQVNGPGINSAQKNKFGRAIAQCLSFPKLYLWTIFAFFVIQIGFSFVG